MMVDYVPGSALLARTLNDLQDEYDSALFAGWKTYMSGFGSVAGVAASGSPTYYMDLTPGYKNPSTIGATSAGGRMVNPATDVPVGQAGASRTRRMKLVAMIVAMGKDDPVTNIFLATRTSATPTYSAAIAGTSVLIPASGIDPATPIGSVRKYESAEFVSTALSTTAPIVIGIAFSAMVDVGVFAHVFVSLMVRQVL